jgi:hypothetical protein
LGEAVKPTGLNSEGELNLEYFRRRWAGGFELKIEPSFSLERRNRLSLKPRSKISILRLPPCGPGK